MNVFRFSFFSIMLSSSVFAEIVPDGSTVTSVSKNSDGIEVVKLANANASGISYNKYERFSVPQAGAHLDNRQSLASTIINQVTSTHRSKLEGNLRVLGAKSHLFIVNPNGIYLDGASFSNTANLALTTGDINFINRNIVVGGVTKSIQNVQIITSKGKVEIGEKGIEADMHSLDLIAKDIRINGSITLEGSENNSQFNIYQGSSTYEYDSSLSVNDTSKQWAKQINTASQTKRELSIDITAQSNINAGSIYIVLNDKGAGFHQAGDLYANQNNLIISSTGQVQIKDGSLKAKGNISIEADSLNIEGATKQSKVIAEQGGLSIKVQKNLINKGGLLQEKQRIASEIDSLGGVTLDIKGDFINRSLGTDRLGVVFSQSDDLNIKVGGYLYNQSARLLSNKKLSINVAGDFYNQKLISEVDKRGIEQPFNYKSDRVWYTLFLLKRRMSGYDINFGEALIKGQGGIILSANDLIINASNIYNLGGSFNLLESGTLSLKSKKIINQAMRTGHARYKKSCLMLCDQKANSSIAIHGGKIQSLGDIKIEALESFSNIGGDIIPRKNLTLSSPSIKLQAIKSYRPIQRTAGLRGLFDLTDAKIVSDDVGASIIALQGNINFITDNPIHVYGGFFNHTQPINAGNSKIIYHYAPQKGDPQLISKIGVLSDLL